MQESSRLQSLERSLFDARNKVGPIIKRGAQVGTVVMMALGPVAGATTVKKPDDNLENFQTDEKVVSQLVVSGPSTILNDGGVMLSGGGLVGKLFDDAFPTAYAQEIETSTIKELEYAKNRRDAYHALSKDLSPEEKFAELNERQWKIYKKMGETFVKEVVNVKEVVTVETEGVIGDILALLGFASREEQETLGGETVKDGIKELDKLGVLASLEIRLSGPPYTEVSNRLKRMSELLEEEIKYADAGDAQRVAETYESRKKIEMELRKDLINIKDDVNRNEASFEAKPNGISTKKSYKLRKGDFVDIESVIPVDAERFSVQTEVTNTLGFLTKLGYKFDIEVYDSSVRIISDKNGDNAIGMDNVEALDIKTAIDKYSMGKELPKKITTKITVESTGKFLGLFREAKDVDVDVFTRVALKPKEYRKVEQRNPVNDYIKSRTALLERLLETERTEPLPITKVALPVIQEKTQEVVKTSAPPITTAPPQTPKPTETPKLENVIVLDGNTNELKELGIDEFIHKYRPKHEVDDPVIQDLYIGEKDGNIVSGVKFRWDYLQFLRSYTITFQKENQEYAFGISIDKNGNVIDGVGVFPKDVYVVVSEEENSIEFMIKDGYSRGVDSSYTKSKLQISDFPKREAVISVDAITDGVGREKFSKRLGSLSNLVNHLDSEVIFQEKPPLPSKSHSPEQTASAFMSLLGRGKYSEALILIDDIRKHLFYEYPGLSTQVFYDATDKMSEIYGKNGENIETDTSRMIIELAYEAPPSTFDYIDYRKIYKITFEKIKTRGSLEESGLFLFRHDYKEGEWFVKEKPYVYVTELKDGSYVIDREGALRTIVGEAAKRMEEQMNK